MAILALSLILILLVSYLINLNHQTPTGKKILDFEVLTGESYQIPKEEIISYQKLKKEVKPILYKFRKYEKLSTCFIHKTFTI